MYVWNDDMQYLLISCYVTLNKYNSIFLSFVFYKFIFLHLNLRFLSLTSSQFHPPPLLCPPWPLLPPLFSEKGRPLLAINKTLHIKLQQD